MSALSDLGFHDIDAARGAVRRLKLRRSLRDLVARGAALVDILDQRADAHGGDRATGGESAVRLASSDHERIVDNGGVQCVHCQHSREKDLLEGVDLFLKLLDRLDIGLRHGLFSGLHADERNEADATAHRLSGAAQ